VKKKFPKKCKGTSQNRGAKGRSLFAQLGDVKPKMRATSKKKFKTKSVAQLQTNRRAPSSHCSLNGGTYVKAR